MSLFRVCLILSLALTGFAGTSQVSPQSVEFVSQPGRLGPELFLSAVATPDVNRYLPSSAYNSKTGETLVVWHRTAAPNYLIEARLVKNGNPVGSAPVVLQNNAVAIKQPAVVYNATENQYLLVYMKNVSGDGVNYDIWGKILEADLSTAVTDFQIISWPDRTFWTPRVAWNSTWDEYLVIWNAFSISGGVPTDIAHAILGPTGNRLYGNIVTSTGFPQNVDVVYNPATDEYLAAWRVMGTSPSNPQIYVALLDGNNALPINPPFQLNLSANDQRYPRVATNGVNSYMVVWEELWPNNNWYVFGRELNLSGVIYGSPHLISAAGVSAEEAYPTIAGFPGYASRYVVAYQVKTDTGMAVRLAYNNNKTNTIDFLGFTNWVDSLAVMDAGFWNATTPTVATSGQGGALIAYQGVSSSDPTSKQHIYARYWTAYQAYLPSIMQ